MSVLSIKRIVLSCAVAAGIGLAGSSRLFADDQPKMPAGMPSQEEMAKLMEEMAKPAAEHELFKKIEGKWDCKVEEFQAPGAPPVESKGTCENRTVLNGLFLHSMFNGEMMGKKYQGMELIGYDKEKKEYQAIWVDSMSSIMASFKGTMKDGKLDMSGDMDDPITKTKMKMHAVTEFPADGSMVFTMSMSGPVTGGQEMKCLQITYTKAK